MEPLIIEVAINELASKRDNPNIPYSLDDVVTDAIACARAGAAIVHLHARDATTGEQRWFFDSGPGNPNGRKAGVNRGVAYWAGSSQGPCGERNRGVDRAVPLGRHLCCGSSWSEVPPRSEYRREVGLRRLQGRSLFLRGTRFALLHQSFS